MTLMQQEEMVEHGGALIHPTSIVDEGAEIGEGTKIWHHCHVRAGAKIEKDCVLGRNVYVEKGAWLQDRVHVQNNVSVYDGVHLWDDVFVGPSVVFTNDKYPRAFAGEDWQRMQTIVKQGASIGAGAVIVCGITIEEYAMIGAGAVIWRNVEPYELVVGHGMSMGKVDRRGVPCLQSSAQK